MDNNVSTWQVIGNDGSVMHRQTMPPDGIHGGLKHLTRYIQEPHDEQTWLRPRTIHFASHSGDIFTELWCVSEEAQGCIWLASCFGDNEHLMELELEHLWEKAQQQSRRSVNFASMSVVHNWYNDLGKKTEYPALDSIHLEAYVMIDWTEPGANSEYLEVSHAVLFEPQFQDLMKGQIAYSAQARLQDDLGSAFTEKWKVEVSAPFMFANYYLYQHLMRVIMNRI